MTTRSVSFATMIITTGRYFVVGPMDQGMPPQPVPPPQMVPPPTVSQMQHSMNLITSVPPPSHPPPQSAPWLYQGQPLPQQPPPQGQMQVSNDGF